MYFLSVTASCCCACHSSFRGGGGVGGGGGRGGGGVVVVVIGGGGVVVEVVGARWVRVVVDAWLAHILSAIRSLLLCFLRNRCLSRALKSIPSLRQSSLFLRSLGHSWDFLLGFFIL